MKRAVMYLRVSTVDQPTANQERDVRGIAGRMGCEITKVYRDHGISGAKGRDKRPAFDALCKAAARREFDVVMAWSVDRLGRSLQDLVGFLGELHAVGVDLFLHQQERVSLHRLRLDALLRSGGYLFARLSGLPESTRGRSQELCVPHRLEQRFDWSKAPVTVMAKY